MSRQSKRRHSKDGIMPAKSVVLAGRGGKAPPTRGQPHVWWMIPAICIFLAAIVWVVFGQTVHDDFVIYDDSRYVYENPVVTAGLTLHGIASSFGSANSDNFIPLTSISHMVDWQFYGRNAGGHHLTNVLLHAANAILLFLVLGAMTGAVWRSAFVAAVFAVHPLHVESVAWVAERKDVLSGLFFMLTLWAYARYAQPAGSRRPKTKIWYGLALAFFTLGLMSKPMLVTVPFVLLLLDYWPLKRVESPGSVFRVRGLVLEKVPFLLLAAADCVATILAQRNGIVSVQHLGFFWRAGNALVAYADYIWQMIYPAGLAVLYPLRGNQLPVWEIAVSALALLVISAGIVVWRRKYPWLMAGWLWYLGMLVPVIGLVQVGNQARADRYTYLPQIGLYILLTWGVAELCRSWRHQRAVLGSAAAVILAGLMAGAHEQAGYWKTSISLWTHTLACTTRNSVAHYNFGYALADEGRFGDAIEQFKQALQINPDYAEGQNNWGNALASEGKATEAIEHYERALQINPDYAEGHNNLGLALAGQGKLEQAVAQYERALQINPENAEARNNLGLALARQGKVTEAIEQYERALKIKPDFAEARVNWGLALAGQGELDAAIEQYNRVLQIKPDYPQAHYELGVALGKQGRLAESVQSYQQALQLNPDYAAAHVELGVTLTRQGKLTEAVEHFERALQIKPDIVQAHYDLGVVLAEQGKATEATMQFQQALDLAASQNNASLANAIRARLGSQPSVPPQPQTR
jgi:tetratricopeptide (TPR) repeat protein